MGSARAVYLALLGQVEAANRGFVMINYSLRISLVYGVVNLLTGQKWNGSRIRLHDKVEVCGC